MCFHKVNKLVPSLMCITDFIILLLCYCYTCINILFMNAWPLPSIYNYEKMWTLTPEYIVLFCLHVSLSLFLQQPVAIFKHFKLFLALRLQRVWDLFLHEVDRTRAPYLALPVFSQLIIPFFFFLTIVFQALLRFHSSHIRMETFILRMTSVVNFSIT